MDINPYAFQAIRELAELSQLRLSKASGVSQARISRIEAGDTTVEKRTANKLAKALNVHLYAIIWAQSDSERGAA